MRGGLCAATGWLKRTQCRPQQVLGGGGLIIRCKVQLSLRNGNSGGGGSGGSGGSGSNEYQLGYSKRTPSRVGSEISAPIANHTNSPQKQIRLAHLAF